MELADDPLVLRTSPIRVLADPLTGPLAAAGSSLVIARTCGASPGRWAR